MYTIQEKEYKALSFFKNLAVIEPTQALVRLRRNVFMWGGFMLFIFFAGLEINGFTGGFIQGKITNTFIIPIYVGIFFFYNFIQYFLQLNNEYSAHSSKKTNIQNYGNELALLVFKKEFIGSHYKLYGDNYSFGICQKELGEKEDSYKVQCDIINIPDFFTNYAEAINSKEGFFIKDNKIFFEYKLSENDLRFYEINHDQLKNADLNECLQYKFPVYFGVFVSALVVYTLIAHYYSLPLLSQFIENVH